MTEAEIERIIAEAVKAMKVDEDEEEDRTEWFEGTGWIL